ncbi:MAG TPA: M20/M25/M40 family metallo-hydrolase [Verrucomicrobiae bacterium]|nr:M20/M25/M40 family metallo-hydrolase [Verrucomicrobiae bacterium]
MGMLTNVKNYDDGKKIMIDKMLLSATIVDETMDELISDLQVLIRQPSVSATNQGLEECALLLAKMMNKSGITTELLYLSKSDHHKSQDENKENNENYLTIPPIVFGEVKSKSNPLGKTILFYNHYDVQPIDPIEKWDEDPFSGKVDGNVIFGRGSSDDKGELITRLKAVEYFLRQTGDVPCNIKFVIEGEEEIGSPNLNKYLLEYIEKFSCDIVIWESGYIDDKGRAILSLGQKGILNVELSIQGPNRDVHSSLAVAIENPAWKLVSILSTLYDGHGKILIDGWYDEDEKLTKMELQQIDKELFDAESFKKEYGIKNFVNNVSSSEIKKNLAIQPTCNISGLYSGYVDQGVKTIIPSSASAKIDFRLVPFMDPKLQFNKLISYLRSKGYSEDDLQITFLSGEPAYRTPLENPYVNLAIRAAKKIFNDVILNISSPGTGPMYAFKKFLNVDSICIGSTILPNKMHSPNEFTNIDLLNKATKCFIEIIKEFSSAI